MTGLELKKLYRDVLYAQIYESNINCYVDSQRIFGRGCWVKERDPILSLLSIVNKVDKKNKFTELELLSLLSWIHCNHLR